MGGIKINTPQQLDFLIKHLIDERDEEIIIPNDIDDKKLLFRSLVNVRPPLEVSDEFLQVQDEFLTNETLNKNLTSAEDISEVKGKLALWQGDITTLKVDAIVNAANSKLLGCFIPLHNCIDNVIHSSAGIQLRQECSEIMRMQGHNEEVGKAKITGAYNLPSRHVIHTVGPAIPYGEEPSSDDCEKLASCYESCLELASYNELKSIAFCSISTGVFNFPQQKAAEIAIKTVEDYLNENESSLEKVIFDTFSDKSYLIYKNLLFGGGQFMDKFVLRLDKAVDAIDDADYVLIGAGAGFSAAAGLEYSGKRFEDNFTDFIEKYGVTDMYSATFYPYETQEAKWGHWARHVYVNRYSVGKTKLYEQLLDLMNDKDYFVLTTNVDHQFWINGFEDKRIFATQGDYGLMQCETACHDKLYSNKKLVFEAIENTQDCMIPSELVPVCPVCGGNMEINVRKDNCFVEDEKWHEMYGNYSKFLENIGTDDRLVLLELGVGFNTPVIIRYPFEHMTHDNPNVNLIRLNRSYAQAIPENKDKTISFDEEISEIFNYWTKRI